MAKKALEEANTKIAHYSANYESTVSLSEYEDVVAQLDKEKTTSTKLKEDIESLSNRYE